MREIPRRTPVIGAFSAGQSGLMLCAARMRHIVGTRRRTQKYMAMGGRYDLNWEQQRQPQDQQHAHAIDHDMTGVSG